MAVVPIVNGAIGILQTYETTRVGQQVMRDLRDRLYAHLQTLPLAFFTGTKTGEIQSRLANDVGGVQSVVTTTASTILANVVIFVSTIVAMVILSWQLTIVAVFTVPVFFWLGQSARLHEGARGLSQRVLLHLGQDRPVAVWACHAAHGDVPPRWQEASRRPYLAAISGPGEIRLRLPADCIARYMRSRHELHVDLAIRAGPVARLGGPDGTSTVVLWVRCRSAAAGDQAECGKARG
jgi:ABC transporter transmembrane region